MVAQSQTKKLLFHHQIQPESKDVKELSSLIFLQKVNVVHCTIWYHLYNLKNVKNTTLLHGCFSSFLNSTNGTKSRNASQMINTSSFHVFNTRYCYNFVSNVMALVLTLELHRIFYILKQDNIDQNYHPFSKNGNTWMEYLS